MTSSNVNWGCCGEGKDEEHHLPCTKCSKIYHLECVGLEIDNITSKKTAAWKCPVCLSLQPRGNKTDNTLIRNVPATRSYKRVAVNSPPNLQHEPTLTREDVTEIVEGVMSSQFNEMLSKMNSTLLGAFDNKLQPIQDEICEMVKAMDYINVQFEDIRREHKISQDDIKALKSENENLKTTMINLENRLSQLEQHARAKNIELQCVPEKNTENLINIITDLGKVIKCDVNEKNIIKCTRVAKLQRDTNRPRSIIVEFVTPRIRDDFIAGVAKYNKNNPTNKLNSSLIGIPGPKTQIFVAEHLSPTNKSLHAAARLKAKQMNYKFIWIKNGRIFTRKNEESPYIWIKDNSCLDKIV
ncbi:hypothetical protein K1T71_001384 [Dendrolimus kikuchii]|uniref:Uncharacterized protein n=2 Tax=Dendrolimus kikuchii TaxID=765133 RepID=A0ACC1DHF6_9NEOP|nr:hypothetical protein K1T71_008947 [Dendrolimus kikuchii]KAJ0183408.1 hypothetical protein K1T71_001384 [Dendrolimus kikuchii]